MCNSCPHSFSNNMRVKNLSQSKAHQLTTISISKIQKTVKLQKISISNQQIILSAGNKIK